MRLLNTVAEQNGVISPRLNSDGMGMGMEIEMSIEIIIFIVKC